MSTKKKRIIALILAASLLLGLVLVPLVSALTQKSKPDGVDEMFSCYDEKVISSAKKSLGD